MKVNISWSVNVDGLWWDIQSEHSIADSLSSNDKMTKIRSVISWLNKASDVVPRAGAIAVNNNGEIKTSQVDPGPPARSPAWTWPFPACTVHGEVMSESKTQREEGHTMFYCPQRQGDAYCRHRAKVNNETGVPKLWEVK